MGFTFCVYKRTGEVHILGDDGQALCKLIDPSACGELKLQYPMEELTKPLTALLECEAVAVAHALQVLRGVNICANCVRKLFKDE
ncbi:MAG: hypothetical protein GXO04_03485 [Aquificae bacterium]|nr:hypothetical protein [Aquificota bacterium]